MINFQLIFCIAQKCLILLTKLKVTSKTSGTFEQNEKSLCLFNEDILI